MILTLPDTTATEKLGRALARVLLPSRLPTRQPNMVVHLQGDLGAGKTTLVRAFLRTAGVTGRIKSPTYTLVEPYVVERDGQPALEPTTAPEQSLVDLQVHSKIYLYHFDFYRFNNPREWLEAGFAELFRDDSICLIEWPEKAGNTLPPADIAISLQHAVSDHADYRRATLQAPTPRGQDCLNKLNIHLML